MKSRHDFLSSIAGASAVTFLPGQTQTLIVDGAANHDAIIDSAEGVRLRAQCKRFTDIEQSIPGSGDLYISF